MFKTKISLKIFSLVLILSILFCNALRGNAETKSATTTETKQNSVDYTAWNDRGEGNFWYLDRHVLDCGKANKNKFINGFEFQRNGDNIRYKFSCTPFSFTGQTQAVKYFNKFLVYH